MKSDLILSFHLEGGCKTMCFYLKLCIKKKNTKQNTKIQPKKNVLKVVNFGSSKID